MRFENKSKITLDLKEKYENGFRWKIGINTVPCIRGRKGKRCIYCGFINWERPIAPQKVGGHFLDFFEKNYTKNISRVEVYCSGNFFDDCEVSASSRQEIIKTLNRKSIKEIVLETRPEFINSKNIEELTKYIDPKKLFIAIGLETMSNEIRKKTAKGFTKKRFIKALDILQKAGVGFQAYLLLKPPVGMSDYESIADLEKSVKELVCLMKNKSSNLVVAIQPFFVAENSPVAKISYFRNEFKPIWLYSIAKSIEILDKIRKEYKYDFKIILGNYNDNVETVSIPSNYDELGKSCICSKKIRDYLTDINRYQKDVRIITDKVLNSKCDCKKLWIKEVGSKLKDFS